MDGECKLTCTPVGARGMSDPMRIARGPARAARGAYLVGLLGVVGWSGCGSSDPAKTDSPDLGFVSRSDGGEDAGMAMAMAMPDFSLLDASPRSATSGMRVSPRDHLSKISAWYFTDAG